jgi:hypothetical protein
MDTMTKRVARTHRICATNCRYIDDYSALPFSRDCLTNLSRSSWGNSKYRVKDNPIAEACRCAIHIILQPLSKGSPTKTITISGIQNDIADRAIAINPGEALPM